MTEALMNRIKAQLVRHEGLRLKPYRCTAGKLTIGIGRNLDDRGISQKEAYAMLERDIQDCEQYMIDEIPEVYNKLDEVRQSVLLNMCISIPQSRFATLRALALNGIARFSLGSKDQRVRMEYKEPFLGFKLTPMFRCSLGFMNSLSTIVALHTFSLA